MPANTKLGHAENGESICLPQEVRQDHLHVIGRWRQGKSKFLENLIRNDIIENRGLCLIDPHGSLYDDLVRWCAYKKSLLGDRKVWLFEPSAENAWAFGFNPLNFQDFTPHELNRAVRNMFRACAQAWDENPHRTPRLARCLPNILHALGEQGLTLREALDLCVPNSNDPLRRYLTSGIKDEVVRDEWQWFDSLPERQFLEYFDSSRNRLSAFVSDPLLRVMLGQTEAAIDFSSVMDNGEIVLVSLASFDKETQRLLGSVLVSDLYSRALKRSTIRSKESPPFYLYLDEAHRFINEDIEGILIETRKFGLWMALAHHNLSQLGEAGNPIRSAVTAIPNKIVFGGLPVPDAKEMAEEIYSGIFDLEGVKHTFDKPTVVGHRREFFKSWSESEGETEHWGSASAHGTGEAEVADADGEQISTSSASSDHDTLTEGGGRSWQRTEGESEGLVPIFEHHPTQGISLEEHIYTASATLAGQPTQHAVVKLVGKPPENIKTTEVGEALVREERVGDFKEERNLLSPFATPKALAERNVEERRRQLREKASPSRQLGKSGFIPDPD